MMNFKRFTVLFFAVLLCLNLAAIFGGASFAGLADHRTCIYLAWIGFYFFTAILLAFFPCSRFHYPVICRAKTGKKEVALTFDDGPDPVSTPRIAAILAKQGVTASFFICGKNTGGREMLLKSLADAGNLLGNHGWSHSPYFDFFPPRKIRMEIEATREAIRAATGRSPLLFRPPYGVVNPMVAGALKHFPGSVIAWNIRSFDTVIRDDAKIHRRILRKLKPGSVILLHDHSRFVQEELENLVVEIKKQGYSIVPLDQLLQIAAYDPN
jgi:peptidoglycan/xylan/chitin deacetylase (PgdA/CDA1 family)